MISGIYIIYMRKERPAAGGPRKQMKKMNALPNGAEPMELPKVDMAPLYRAALQMKKNYDHPSAHINVLPDLGAEVDVLHVLTMSGYELILLKNDEPQKLLDRVLAEVDKIGSPDLPIVDNSKTSARLEGNIMQCCFDGEPVDSVTNPVSNDIRIEMGYQMWNLQFILYKLSKDYRVFCPQILLTPEYFSSGACVFDDNNDARLILLNTNDDMIYCLLHEFRHVWQRKYHPEIFDNYIELPACMDKYKKNYSNVYNAQLAEFDANVFACHFLKRLNPEFRGLSNIFPNACRAIQCSETIAEAIPFFLTWQVFSSLDTGLYKKTYPALIV